MSNENGWNWLRSYLSKIGKVLFALSYILIIFNTLGFNLNLPATYRGYNTDEKIALLGFIILGINIFILHAGLTYIYRKTKTGNLVNIEKVIKNAKNFANDHYRGHNINIMSAVIDEIGGLPIYKVTGEAISSANKGKYFTIQINPKNGNVSGFNWGAAEQKSL